MDNTIIAEIINCIQDQIREAISEKRPAGSENTPVEGIIKAKDLDEEIHFKACGVTNPFLNKIDLEDRPFNGELFRITVLRGGDDATTTEGTLDQLLYFWLFQHNLLDPLAWLQSDIDTRIFF